MPKSRGYLYDLFRNNRKPNEDDFKNLIDSSVNLQDDRPNAGWYYFQFLPHPQYGETADSRLHTKFPEFQNLGSITRAQSLKPDSETFLGLMNIPVPKGVSKISNFKVKGYLGNRVTPINPPLLLQLTIFKLSRAICKIEVNSPISTPVDQEVKSTDVPVPVNPNQDALYLKVLANPRKEMNFIDIEFIGIEFS